MTRRGSRAGGEGDRPATSRRRALALALAGSGLAGSAALAGCLAGGGPRPATDPWIRRSAVEAADARGVEGAVRLRHGEFVALPLEVTEAETAGTLRVRARERLSLPVDLLTLRRASLDAYRAGESVDPISSLSALDSPAARVEGRLPTGEYALVVDNTRLGGAPPFDAVRVGVRAALEL